MAEIIEGHIRFHVLNPDGKQSPQQTEAVEELIGVVKTHLKRSRVQLRLSAVVLA
jgi:FrmR/RcnR family transcriptional regulator, repressor of frmRAB operon